MKAAATIQALSKPKKPFIHNGRKDTFIKTNPVKNIDTSRVAMEEDKAGIFAQNAATNPRILQTFFKNAPGRTSAKTKNAETDEEGIALSEAIIDAFKIHFGKDFTNVRIHADELSTKISKQYNAAALTSGKHIFLNLDVYNRESPDGLLLLAHELFHTLYADNQHDTLEVKLKPLTELHDQTPEQKQALLQSAEIALGENDKVNSGV